MRPHGAAGDSNFLAVAVKRGGDDAGRGGVLEVACTHDAVVVCTGVFVGEWWLTLVVPVACVVSLLVLAV